MCTDRHLGIDTDQVISLCKSIIKVCKDQPHAVDSLLEQAYVELSAVSMMMKQSADRAAIEQALYDKKQNGRTALRKTIPGLAKKYAAYLTTPKLEKMLAGMDPAELKAIAERVQARKE
jgi:arginine repressor